jgi:hypothetical protein
MPGVLLRQSPSSKPPIGSQVNWGHPLARGLSYCAPLNEGGGHATDLVSGNYGGGAVGWTTSVAGRGTAGSGYGSTAPTVGNPPFTVAALVVVYGVPSSGYSNLIANVNFVSGSNNQGFDLQMQPTTDTWSGVAWKVFANTVNENNQVIANDPSPPLGVPLLYVGTYDGAAGSLYRNGRLIGSASASYLTPANPLVYGGDVPAASAVTHFGYVWNRILTLGEMARLLVEPFGMLQPASQAQRLWLAAPSLPQRIASWPQAMWRSAYR